MNQIINFIPKTTEECRRLVAALKKSPEGATVEDRYQCVAYLNGKEVAELISLIESQIGAEVPVEEEKAPEVKETPEEKEKSADEPEKSQKKSNRKSAKK